MIPSLSGQILARQAAMFRCGKVYNNLHNLPCVSNRDTIYSGARAGVPTILCDEGCADANANRNSTDNTAIPANGGEIISVGTPRALIVSEEFDSGNAVECRCDGGDPT